MSAHGRGSAEFRGSERFTVRRRIGAGGMGVVYEAIDRDHNANVALKTLRHLNAQALYRFKKEFRALQDIQHANLVSFGELIEEDGRWFFTMELINGSNLLDYIRPRGLKQPSFDSAAFEPTETGDGTNSISDGIPVLRPPSPQPFDEQRVRSVLGQLALGLCALHAAGKVHRDIKPSNVLVTRDGRAVLLDFGLVAEVSEHEYATEAHVVGTAAYMAPEQAASKPVGPEADWYSVGVVLYEMLTGGLPFEGTSLQILMEKQRAEPQPPSASAPSVPSDLDELCTDLLRFDPAARPTGRSVLARLGVEASPSQGPATLTSSDVSQTVPFVGREGELAHLNGALADVDQWSAVTVYVRGQSGLGKSRLIRAFTAAAQAERSDVVVLAGRCYEREEVPYKGLDGVVDSLSRYLLQLSDAEVAELVPRHASLLARVFPVLGRVEIIAQVPQRERNLRDVHEVRSRAFGALRELLSRLAERRRLIVVVDDLQWADKDSLALLDELLRPPDAPPMLVLISERTEADGPPAPRLPGDVRAIDLGPLEPTAARRLARLLLDRFPSSHEISASSIAVEARGHPLYVDELVRHAAGGDTVDETPRLDDAIWNRVQALGTDVLRLLQLVCLAGSPISRDVVSRASELGPDLFARHTSLLRVANLVRGRGNRTSAVLEPYHDRVREAVTEHVRGELRVELHGRLAVALELAGSAQDRPELLLLHLEGAGEAENAAQHATSAAGRAKRALAFDRAAALYRTALRLGRYSDTQARELRLQLADSLAYAGRGREAAHVYLQAAKGADATARLKRRSRAAHHLLVSGHLDDGMEVLTDVAHDAGVWLPSGKRGAFASIVWNRLRLKLRGMRVRLRDPGEIPPQKLVKIDVYMSAARAFGLVDPLRAWELHTRGMLLAFKLGEPTRVMRAISQDAIVVASTGAGGVRKGRALLAQLNTMAHERGDEFHLATAAGLDGILCAYEGRFKEAAEKIASTWSQLQEHAIEWEDEQIYETYGTLVAWFLGNLGDMQRRRQQNLLAARRSGNLYQETTSRIFFTVLELARDDPASARREIAEVAWAPPSDSYHIQHLLELLARADIDIYEDSGDDLIARYAPEFTAYEKSSLPRGSQVLRCWAAWTWGRLAIASGNAKEVARAHKHLTGEDAPYAAAWAAPIRAAAAAMAGQLPTVERSMRKTVDLAESFDMALLAVSARRQLGVLVGSDEGAALIEKADAWMRSHGISSPARFARMFAPAPAPS